jgi:hypothetical protein
MTRIFPFTGPSIRTPTNETIYITAIGCELGLALRPLGISSTIFGPAVARDETEVTDRENSRVESNMASRFELPLLRIARDTICNSM